MYAVFGSEISLGFPLKVREISRGVVPPRIVTLSRHGAIFACWHAEVRAKFSSLTKRLRTHQAEGKITSLKSCTLCIEISPKRIETTMEFLREYAPTCYINLKRVISCCLVRSCYGSNASCKIRGETDNLFSFLEAYKEDSIIELNNEQTCNAIKDNSIDK